MPGFAYIFRMIVICTVVIAGIFSGLTVSGQSGMPVRLLDIAPSEFSTPNISEYADEQRRILWQDGFEGDLSGWTFFPDFYPLDPVEIPNWDVRSREGTGEDHLTGDARVAGIPTTCLSSRRNEKNPFCLYITNIAVAPGTRMRVGVWTKARRNSSGFGEIWIMETRDPVSPESITEWSIVNPITLSRHRHSGKDQLPDRWFYLHSEFTTTSETRNLLIYLNAAGDPGQEVIFDDITVRNHLNDWVLPDQNRGYFDADKERRDALILPPGSTVSWPVRNIGGTDLHFSVFPGRTHPTCSFQELTVSADYPDAGRQVLIRREFGTGANPWDGWQDISLPLRHAGEQPVSITVQTSGAGVSSPLEFPFLVLGHPVVIDGRGHSSRKNVVLISMDTLRGDGPGVCGNSRPVSPVLDRFSRTAAQFANCLSHAPSTLPSHASLFTSEYPSRHGLNRGSLDETLPRDTELLSEILRENGYLTAAFTAGGQMSGRYGFCRGFDIYAESEYHSGPIFGQGKSWLDTIPVSQPFFLFLHTYEVHHPYQPSPEFIGALDPDYTGKVDGEMETIHAINLGEISAADRDVRHMQLLYEAQFRDFDHVFEDFLGFLNEKNLRDNTLLIFLSDHGEEFGEHGVVGWHSHTLYDELLRVPMMISCPALNLVRGIIPDTVCLVDLLPTVMDLLALPSGTDAWAGESLAGMLRKKSAGDFHRENRSFFAEKNWDGVARSIIRGSDKLIYDFEHRVSHFFDLDRDPREQRPLPSRGPVYRDLLDRLMAWTVETHRGYALILDAGDVPGAWTVEITGGVRDHGMLPLWAGPEDRMSRKGGVFLLEFQKSAGRRGFCFTTDPQGSPIEIRVYRNSNLFNEARMHGADGIALNNPIRLSELALILPVERDCPALVEKVPSVRLIKTGEILTDRFDADGAFQDELKALGYVL